MEVIPASKIAGSCSEKEGKACMCVGVCIKESEREKDECVLRFERDEERKDDGD